MMKKVKCPNCDGVGHMRFYPDRKYPGALVADMCPKCYGTGQIEVPMTNADMVREMDDEAIANVLLDWFCIGNRECYTRNREEVRNEILQWLQSNVIA